MDNMDEFRQIFFTESAELIADMEARLLALDEGTQDKEQLNAIFRCAHSIKGGSGAFGLDSLMRFTHIMEALLDAMRDGSLLPTRAAIDTLLKSVDILTQMLAAAQENRELSPGFGAEVAQALQGFTQGGDIMPIPSVSATIAPKATSIGKHYNILFAPQQNLFTTGNEPLLILRELSRLGQVEITADTSAVPAFGNLNPADCLLKWNISLRGDISLEEINDVFEFIQDLAEIQITEQVDETADKAIPAKKPSFTEDAAVTKTNANTSIRVDLDKVDRLVNMVGELVITEAMLRAQAKHLPSDQFTELMRGVDELSHHTRELQEAVMAVRMQPVKSVFSRMPRIVRDTANALGKDIQIILHGENTEVDKTVIEQLSDPLTHMIRNSCDHGIETPDQRAWNDKPLQGTITLSAYHRSGRIMIEIADDGAGINRQRVLDKARQKGLVAEDAQLNDEEIDHLIFHPGFSTAEKVTSLSGRGVGMDVVRRNIESLGGTVRITNNPGKGSVFTVSLPLTLAILDGMIVRVGAENYIVPITSIIETLRPKREEIQHVLGKGNMINVRGEFVPVVPLHRIFDIKNAETVPSNGLIVLVESGNNRMGLAVDELVGQQQVVIKSLEANSDPVKGISGATILGDGRVSLILEINELKTLFQQAQNLSSVA